MEIAVGLQRRASTRQRPGIPPQEVETQPSNVATGSATMKAFPKVVVIVASISAQASYTLVNNQNHIRPCTCAGLEEDARLKLASAGAFLPGKPISDPGGFHAAEKNSNRR